MAATGNEAARLEQLKGLYPQVVSFTIGRSASITLGNGKVVTFSGIDGGSGAGGNNGVHMLVKVMHNCFEILQLVSEPGSNMLVIVTCQDGMNTFATKFTSLEEGYITFKSSTNNLQTTQVPANATDFNIITTGESIVFIEALIYVE